MTNSTVDKANHAEKLGMRLLEARNGEVYVDGIVDGGLVSLHNKANDAASQITIGDVVVVVNGKSGSFEEMVEATAGSSVTLELRSSQAPPQRSADGHLEVALAKSPTENVLGVSVFSHENGQTMRMENLRDKGLVASYNRKAGKDDFFRLKDADIILAVNGVSGSFSAMLTALGSQVVWLLVAREAQAQERADLPQEEPEQASAALASPPVVDAALEPAAITAPAMETEEITAAPPLSDEQAAPEVQPQVQLVPEADPQPPEENVEAQTMPTEFADEDAEGREPTDVIPVTEDRLSPRDENPKVCGCF
eukprot:TRINITY_DN11824_c1_g1_i2.p1 TRINITY_DN11824_c1_g1~~TRINITY_DN11824_c1_g1_i2.p1  ORF type:complete len:309 (-),score=91.17 TRINITY_DN11824_c1_g1_i2:273-1199(-)